MTNSNEQKKNLPFPKFRCIEQNLKAPKIEHVEQEMHKVLSKYQIENYIREGDSVALTASSRGIAHQDLLLKAVVEKIKKIGGHPFIFPAMGSHGGATAEGQIGVLKEYGITEESVGCPIKATMEVVSIGESKFGEPIYIDKYATEADKIVLLNRI